MDSHNKNDQQPDEKDYKSTSRFESSMPETSTETKVPADEQSHQEVQTVQDPINLDEPVKGKECKEGFSSVTSVIDEVKEAEEKDLADAKENLRKTLTKLQDETTGSSFQDITKVDERSPFQDTGVDSVSELGVKSLAELPSDRLSGAVTASANTFTSSQSYSQPIAIPSTSRDSLGLGNERNPRKRPTHFGLNLKQSIHIFDPSSCSVLKRLPVPYRRSHNVYLRNSPESSDYGGSPDSLEDLLMMEALNSSNENSESTSRPQTPLDKDEIEKPSESSSVGEGRDVHPPEPVGEGLDDYPTKPVGEGLDDYPTEPVGEGLDDNPTEPVGEGLDDHPTEPVGEGLDDHPTEC